MKREVCLSVNGEPVQAEVEPRTHLADFLRETRGLTGTHLGCEHGVCGACTIEIDGIPVRSCITFAVACEGASVRTVEGFADDPVMAALRETFWQRHALQCGYCTPGMLITARDIVLRLPGADEARVREELSGNLCRCTGYVGIVQAILDVLASPPPRGSAAAEATPAPRDPGPVASSEALPRAQPGGERSVVRAAPAPAGEALTHHVSLECEPDAVWQILRQPATAVGCMPGAELTGPADASPLGWRMSAAIGPMRASFEGKANVTYDDGTRTGSIDGEGHDALSRSSARGRVEFSVEPGASGAELTATITYRIAGPLAQFSRGSVVDAVVQQLIERFARNVAAAARGAPVEDAAAPGGIGLVLAALWARIRRLLGG